MQVAPLSPTNTHGTSNATILIHSQAFSFFDEFNFPVFSRFLQTIFCKGMNWISIIEETPLSCVLDVFLFLCCTICYVYCLHLYCLLCEHRRWLLRLLGVVICGSATGLEQETLLKYHICSSSQKKFSTSGCGSGRLCMSFKSEAQDSSR